MGAVAVLPARLREGLRWFRLTPFDEDTPEGRAQERQRRAALSAAASALSKILSVLATLVSIPLALAYLGVERFGIWSVLSALMLGLQFADLGLGNGVINTVSAAYGARDASALRRCVSSGAFALLGVSAVLALVALAVVPNVDWAHVFTVKSTQASSEVLPAVSAFAVCVALAVPLGLVQRVQIALQKGFIPSVWQCLANLLSLLAIWQATVWQLGLPWLVLALLGAPLVTGLLNALFYFGHVEPTLRPSWAQVDREATMLLLRTGGSYFVIQVAAAVVFASDSVFIAHLLGASEVARYAVPEKLFGVISLVVATAVGPLWPAYGEAIASGDIDWVRQALKRSLVLAAAFSASAAAVLLLLGPWLIELWVGPALQVPSYLLLALGIWKILESVGFALAMFLNGAGILRFQMINAWLMATLVLAVKVPLIVVLGPTGAPLTTATVYLIVTLIPLIFLIPRMLHRLRSPGNLHRQVSTGQLR
ncbi:MAG: oligosaccharide flippase family protein [Betaproteobacteria bacterium]|nr:oligosaccharide flippase family protein [Betaproteobacteria bacterium]MBK8105749.1 oligosaccharide flippase family protein [Betaproteobacteria bacterium]MBL0297920.1 oligosaccharide flippase family protein [Betaproteobacteria bacterium]